MWQWAIPLILLAVFLGMILGMLVRKYFAEAKIESAEREAVRILDEAYKNAESKKREVVLEAKEETHRMRTEFEHEVRERRNELLRLEKRLGQREETLDKRSEILEQREQSVKDKSAHLDRELKRVEEVKAAQEAEMERISGLSKSEARDLVLRRTEEEARHEAAAIARDIESRAREEGEKKARDIISLAIQRCAADHVAESTVSVVELPNDEMKGRIIGREGRNIRTFEALSGVDLIIDDTPEAVVVSAFDPIRREKARVALSKLIADGRIHPARIEEMYGKAEDEVEKLIREEGEQAAYDTGIHGLHPELIRLLGRLKFRSSYGQNVLKHSLEVAHLAGLMAAELGANVKIARRAGLLHDIGKAVDHEVEGTHVTIGMELLKRYREDPSIIAAMSAHHGDFEADSIEAVLVTAADALSAARPGARRETLDAYIKRLQSLEEIADAVEGVEKSYAIQAGREIRIMVKPEQVSDAEAYAVARDIVKKVEEQVDYPGQIKVTVIRETRAVEYAR